MRISSAAFLVVVLGAACSTVRLVLPTDPAWHYPASGCRGVGLDGVLRSSGSDPRLFWMEDRRTGKRADLIWPVGYTARDDFGLEILDDANTFVGKAGDLVTGACFNGPKPSDPYHVTADEIQSVP